jgi:serine/threonine-protein kinase
MKHVREPLPDIQARRADVSAALAAVIDHATAKQVNRRYLDAADLIADLEEALAIETVRSGQATGEATSVLRTLPGRSRRWLPFHVRAPRWLPAALALFAVLAGVVLVILLAPRTHHGTGAPPAVPRLQGTAPLVGIGLAADAAHGYNPFGSPSDEHPNPGLAVDNDPNTYWSTQHYNNADLAKPGTGIYVDAAPGVVARQLTVMTDTPGFTAEVYGASGDTAPATVPGTWIQLAPPMTIQSPAHIALDSGHGKLRFFLLWITHLPPNTDFAHINELSLYR